MSQISTIQTELENLFDYLYANAPVRTPIAIWKEVEKILLTGMYIEESRGLNPAFQLSRSDMLKVRRMERSTISSISSLVKADFERMVNQVPENGLHPIQLDDQNIATVCYTFSGIDLTSGDVDIVGEALEVFRHSWSKRNGGQFFTDPAITRLAIDLLDFNPYEGDDLIDPAAGTGGFLLAAINHIKEKTPVNNTSIRYQDKVGFAKIVEKSLKGVEIDKSLVEIANATIASRIGKDNTQIVISGNSLDMNDAERLSEIAIFDGSHICVATNPPFGSKITVKDPSILVNFELSRMHRNNSVAQRPGTRYSPTSLDILFLERTISMLKPGYGTLAIVLPYQLTSGPHAFFVRHWLLHRAKIKAVIDLPPDTFQPYTGTKTCLALLERRHTTLSKLSSSDDEPIFMSVPKWIGHDRRGKPVFKYSPTGQLTDEILTDIDNVAMAYHAFRSGKSPSEIHSESFTVSSESVYSEDQLRFNARFFQPNRFRDAVKNNSGTSAWKTVKLGDVTKKIFFPGRFKRRYVEESEESVPFLGGANISQFTPIVEKWLSNSDPLLDRLQVFPGWILITRSGTTGIVSSVPSHWSGWAVSEHVIRIVPDPDMLDPSYLEAYLRTKFAKASMQRGVFGSVIDEITPEFLGSIDILIPVDDELKSEIIRKSTSSQIAREQAIRSLQESVRMIEDNIEH